MLGAVSACTLVLRKFQPGQWRVLKSELEESCIRTPPCAVIGGSSSGKPGLGTNTMEGPEGCQSTTHPTLPQLLPAAREVSSLFMVPQPASALITENSN